MDANVSSENFEPFKDCYNPVFDLGDDGHVTDYAERPELFRWSFMQEHGVSE